MKVYRIRNLIALTEHSKDHENNKNMVVESMIKVMGMTYRIACYR